MIVTTESHRMSVCAAGVTLPLPAELTLTLSLNVFLSNIAVQVVSLTILTSICSCGIIIELSVLAQCLK